MRYWSLAGAYVLNDPFFTLVFDKLSESLLYDSHSITHARTMILPSRNGTEDVSEMVAEPNWQEVEEVIGFPCILKPVDGYAWQDVFKATDPATLRGLYESLKDRRTTDRAAAHLVRRLLQGLLRECARRVHRPVDAPAF